MVTIGKQRGGGTRVDGPQKSRYLELPVLQGGKLE